MSVNVNILTYKSSSTTITITAFAACDGYNTPAAYCSISSDPSILITLLIGDNIPFKDCKIFWDGMSLIPSGFTVVYMGSKLKGVIATSVQPCALLPNNGLSIASPQSRQRSDDTSFFNSEYILLLVCIIILLIYVFTSV